MLKARLEWQRAKEGGRRLVPSSESQKRKESGLGELEGGEWGSVGEMLRSRVDEIF